MDEYIDVDAQRPRHLLPSIKKICAKQVRTTTTRVRSYTLTLVSPKDEDLHYPRLEAFLKEEFLTKLFFDNLVNQTIRKELFK